MTEYCSHIKCKKKLKLISFDCKCCSQHRYLNSHNSPLLQVKKNNHKNNNSQIKSDKIVNI